MTVHTEVPAGVEEAFMEGFEPTMSFGLVNDVDRCTINSVNNAKDSCAKNI